MSDISLTQSVVAGLFLLLAAFTGAALARRSEYEKWLRHEKSKIFGEFLRELHDVRLAAGAAYYSQKADEINKSIKATEGFARLQKFSGIARLYMSDKGRANLSKLLNDLRVNCTVQGGPASRTVQIGILMEEIQLLLERELNLLPWIPRWLLWPAR
jgi:hypothetical protein